MDVVLVSALVAFVVTGVLALLLVLAERYLVNYGPCSINVNAGARQLEVEGGRPLLAALKEEGIFIPSACGGRGTCSYCKVKISEGGGPIVPTETPLLTQEEIASSVRISCQVKVRNDMAIEIPEALFQITEYRGVVERIRDLTYDVKELRIRLVEPDTMPFVPGQYVQLQTPERPGADSVYRAYSMSNPISDDHCIELIVRHVPGGICTTWIFQELTEGAEVTMTGPFGDFRLSDADRGMIWIAGGSGMAPFWSMVRHMKDEGIARPCTYFFGAVAGKDLFLVDELHALEKELPWFTFVPALSAPADGDDWDGERGLITEVVERHVASGDNTEAYLCGSPGMIDAAAKVLRAKGVVEERTFYDKFA